MIRHRLAMRRASRERARADIVFRDMESAVQTLRPFIEYVRSFAEAMGVSFGSAVAVIATSIRLPPPPSDPTLGPDYEDHAGGGVSSRDLDELLADIDDTLADHKTSR